MLANAGQPQTVEKTAFPPYSHAGCFFMTTGLPGESIPLLVESGCMLSEHGFQCVLELLYHAVTLRVLGGGV